MTLEKDTTELRQSIIDACLTMNATGLNQGTSGNISVRTESGVVITPSGKPYNETHPSDIVLMESDGAYDKSIDPAKPSTEWRFHVDIYADRDDINAIVHTHSLYATTLSMLRWDIPACHYMIAVFGGSSIRCSDYAIFGSRELSAAAVKALKDRTACLLGSHGMIACGKNLKEAMWRAVELETLAHQYYLSVQIGKPVIMSDDHVAEVAARMKSGYGVWENTD